MNVIFDRKRPCLLSNTLAPPKLGTEATTSSEHNKSQPQLDSSYLAHPTAVPSVSLLIVHIMAQDPVQLTAQAKKAYSSGASRSFLNPLTWFISKTDSLENAAELYVKAAAAYRAKRAMREAGMAYEKVPSPFLFPSFSLRPHCTTY